MIVVLTGRKKKWPEYGAYRTSPKGSKFCGVRYRIEAVYQRTVAELDAMGSVFWLAFVPLAVDADEEKIRVVIESLRTRTNEDDFAELGATMLAMAALKKKDAPNLVDMIRSLLSSEVSMQHPFYQEGLAKGLEQGLEKGLEQGREQGREEARKAFAVLAHQFERRLRRKMTDAERRRVAVRLRKDGPEKLGDVVLDLSRDELNAWLAPRKSTTPKRAA